MAKATDEIERILTDAAKRTEMVNTIARQIKQTQSLPEQQATAASLEGLVQSASIQGQPERVNST